MFAALLFTLSGMVNMFANVSQAATSQFNPHLSAEKHCHLSNACSEFAGLKQKADTVKPPEFPHQNSRQSWMF